MLTLDFGRLKFAFDLRFLPLGGWAWGDRPRASRRARGARACGSRVHAVCLVEMRWAWAMDPNTLQGLQTYDDDDGCGRRLERLLTTACSTGCSGWTTPHLGYGASRLVGVGRRSSGPLPTLM